MVVPYRRRASKRYQENTVQLLNRNNKHARAAPVRSWAIDVFTGIFILLYR